MFTSPGMQSLLSQMTQNPQLMQNMMNAPYTQNMFQSMAQNPDLAANIISSNPLFAGNQQMQVSFFRSINFTKFIHTLQREYQSIYCHFSLFFYFYKKEAFLVTTKVDCFKMAYSRRSPLTELAQG